MLINNLEKDPQTFWEAINSIFYKSITPFDKAKIDTLISQLSDPPPGNIHKIFLFLQIWDMIALISGFGVI